MKEETGETVYAKSLVRQGHKGREGDSLKECGRVRKTKRVSGRETRPLSSRCWSVEEKRVAEVLVAASTRLPWYERATSGGTRMGSTRRSTERSEEPVVD